MMGSGLWRMLGVVMACAVAPHVAMGQPVPLASAVRTIFLDAAGHAFSVPSTVAYHPGFDRYYTSDTGSSSGPGFVFGAAGGTPLQAHEPLGVDPRAWNFNPNTGQLEIVTYNAVSGGTGLGLLAPGVDVTGALTGTATELLPTMPGNAGSQTAPAYDALRDVFYSRDASNAVNVVRRSDGSLAGTILLDFTAAGVAAAHSDGIMFAPEVDWILVLDSSTSAAAAFDLAGRYVGTSTLDITTSGTSRRPGYANGQLFAFDVDRVGWQGFTILDAACFVDADCDDGDACTDDVCDENLACVRTDNTAVCEDGDACSVSDACSSGICTGSVAGFDGLACLLRRLRAPELCADPVPAALGRFVRKRAAKAQTQAEAAELIIATGGSAGRAQSLLGKARTSLETIGTKAAKAEQSTKAGKSITPACAATIAGLVQEPSDLLGTLGL